MNPLNIFKQVDLPAPLCPNKPNIYYFYTLNDISLTTKFSL